MVAVVRGREGVECQLSDSPSSYLSQCLPPYNPHWYGESLRESSAVFLSLTILTPFLPLPRHSVVDSRSDWHQTLHTHVSAGSLQGIAESLPPVQLMPVGYRLYSAATSFKPQGVFALQFMYLHCNSYIMRYIYMYFNTLSRFGKKASKIITLEKCTTLLSKAVIWWSILWHIVFSGLLVHVGFTR